MFETIRQQMQTIEEFLKTLGYDYVEVLNFTIRPSEIAVVLNASDTFQSEVSRDHRYKQFAYDSIRADSLEELWTALYALPSRAVRELHVLANQLTGITGMEQELRSVLVKQMILPILEKRNEMQRYLVAPTAVDLGDEIPF